MNDIDRSDATKSRVFRKRMYEITRIDRELEAKSGGESPS